jgi:tRNA U34 2-thiouridine synthase MnmA/TrmU
MPQALVLLSGGLDSALAAKVLMEQGIEVVGINFFSYFTNPNKARRSAQELGIKLIEIDLSDQHLAMVKNPQYGYGKNMNPCIDCHGFMLREAKRVLLREKFDFIATGEILGQRPMSQNKDSLDIVAKISGAEELVLRPLSANLLKETEMEKIGLVNREKLLAISGRARNEQLKLAKKYNLRAYDSPAGGCLLTDFEFSQRLIKMFSYWPDCSGNDVQLLKNGRIYWLETINKNRALIIIARDQKESESLIKLAKTGDIIIELINKTGPTTLIRILGAKLSAPKKETKILIPEEIKLSALKIKEPKSENKIINIAGLLTGYYAVKIRGEEAKLKIREI